MILDSTKRQWSTIKVTYRGASTTDTHNGRSQKREREAAMKPAHHYTVIITPFGSQERSKLWYLRPRGRTMWLLMWIVKYISSLNTHVYKTYLQISATTTTHNIWLHVNYIHTYITTQAFCKKWLLLVLNPL